MTESGRSGLVGFLKALGIIALVCVMFPAGLASLCGVAFGNSEMAWGGVAVVVMAGVAIYLLSRPRTPPSEPPGPPT